MKWLEKHFVSKKEIIKVVGALGPGSRPTEELADVVYSVRNFNKSGEAAKPTERAVDGAMFRALRATGAIMERGEVEKEDGKKKIIIVYSINSVQ